MFQEITIVVPTWELLSIVFSKLLFAYLSIGMVAYTVHCFVVVMVDYRAARAIPFNLKIILIIIFCIVVWPFTIISIRNNLDIHVDIADRYNGKNNW